MHHFMRGQLYVTTIPAREAMRCLTYYHIQCQQVNTVYVLSSDFNRFIFSFRDEVCSILCVPRFCGGLEPPRCIEMRASRRMPRHTRDLLTVQSAKFEKLPSDKGAKIQRIKMVENCGTGCTFYSIRKKLSTLAVRFTLAFSEEVSRNHLRPFSVPWDLDNYYRIGF